MDDKGAVVLLRGTWDSGRTDPSGRWSPLRGTHVSAWWGAGQLPAHPHVPSPAFFVPLLEKNSEAFFAGRLIRFKKDRYPVPRTAPSAEGVERMTVLFPQATTQTAVRWTVVS